MPARSKLWPALALAFGGLAASACPAPRPASKEQERARAAASAKIAAPSAKSATSAAPPTASAALAQSALAEAGATALGPSGTSGTGGGTGAESLPVILDELVDVGPAGPASASVHGIVLIDKKDGLHVARRGAASKGSRPGKSSFTPIELSRVAFAPYGKGPAIAEGHAYWVSQGRLMRRRLDGSGEAEILARDARTGTRVGAARLGKGSALAAYVVAPGSAQTPRAKLWLEGGKSHELTPDGAGASSVALVEQRGGWTVLALDGRSAMTPLHARRVIANGKDVTLGSDVVVWVGASSQATTEIIAGTRGDDLWGFVAIELDVLHFGLAQIHVGTEPHLDAEVVVLPFENGINTAPIAATAACGRTLVVFARPASKEPGSPQELVLAELAEKGIRGGSIVARSRAFADASLARFESGAVLAYTADHRTWGATIRCRQ